MMYQSSLDAGLSNELISQSSQIGPLSTLTRLIVPGWEWTLKTLLL